jgi:3-deoxy-D-manno-octulosonic-acid transferase
MSRLVHALYTLLFIVLLPVVVLRLWWRGRKAPGYREGIAERFGRVQTSNARPLWVHAVSLGESIAISPMIERWLADHPDIPVHVTNMTPTGRDHIRKQFGQRVTQSYCPYDVPSFLNVFLNRLNPIACVVVETELWPNLVRACFKKQVPLLVANARLSERSAKGYRKFHVLSAPMLSRITHIVAQSQADADRFIGLGVPKTGVTVSGSIKFDIHLDADKTELGQSLRSQWLGDKPDAFVLMLASSHADEEAQFLEAFQPLLVTYPKLRLLIVPRHPERFAPVWQLISESGVSASRRSDISERAILLGDSLGEMMAYYSMSDTVIMGGSFVDVGGHNPIEPAILSVPVVMGPHFHNFKVITEAMVERDAMWQVASMSQAKSVVVDALEKPALCRSVGEAASVYAREQQGALGRLLQQVEAIAGIDP